jgi:glutathione S-transferase
MRYELYYWPGIQGRGEFVRLALEEADAPYLDIAQVPERKGGGVVALLRLLDGRTVATPSFAPPFLKAGRLVIGQTANILMYLGARHGLAPKGEAGCLWAHQLQLTIADLLQEVHDTHHPISGNLYYEEQRAAAVRRAADFRKTRLPKYLGYFERVLAGNPAHRGFLIGARLTYPDLSLFQMVAGLRYAFPNAMKRLGRKHPRVVALHDTVAARPRIARYLGSERRQPFCDEDIFRRYPALDAKG